MEPKETIQKSLKCKMGGHSAASETQEEISERANAFESIKRSKYIYEAQIEKLKQENLQLRKEVDACHQKLHKGEDSSSE